MPAQDNYGKFLGAVKIELYSDGRNLNVQHQLPDGDGKNGIRADQQGVYLSAAETLIRKIEKSGPRVILDEVRHGYKWAVRYEKEPGRRHPKAVPLKLGEKTVLGQYCGSIVIDIYNDGGMLYHRCFFPIGNGFGGLADSQKDMYLGAAKALQNSINMLGPGKLIELVAPTKAPLPVKEINV